MKNDTLLTIPELMDFLQVKRNTIYSLRKLGLPTVKMGRSVRFRLESILKWLSDMEEGPQTNVNGLMARDCAHLL